MSKDSHVRSGDCCTVTTKESMKTYENAECIMSKKVREEHENTFTKGEPAPATEGVL